MSFPSSLRAQSSSSSSHSSSLSSHSSSPSSQSSSPRRRGSSCKFAFTLGLLLTLLASTIQAVPNIEIEGLMPPNAAVLTVDGQRKLVKIGQTFKDVTLVSVYTRTATLEVDGQQTVLGISRKVGANYQETIARRVEIPRNQKLQYMTTATINGRQAQVMVDTGANVVAMNLEQARRLGVATDDTQRILVETASGKAAAWKAKLNSVDVGGIRVNHVDATVVDGVFPTVILLGMTYLRHVKIEENQGIMTISREH